MRRDITEAKVPYDRPIDKQFPSRRVAYYALSLLMLAAIASLLDRQILSLLVVPIKQTFALSDTQASLLQGLSFAMFYASMGLPLGWAADRVSRRNMIVASLLCWSAATMSCGLAQTYWQLFFARMLVGAGEAGLHPAAYSMMYDLFRPSHRGRAMSLFGGAASVGHASSLLLAAVIVTFLTTGVATYFTFLQDLPGWRVAFLVAGVPGIVIAALMFTIKEPKRIKAVRSADPAAAKPALLPFVRANKAALFFVLASACLMHMCGYGVIAWMSTGLVRGFDISLDRAGLICGFVLLTGALIGAPIGGYVSDRLAQSRVVGGRFALALFTLPISTAGFVAWWLCSSIELGAAFGSLAFMAQIACLTVLPATLSDLVPNELRGRMAAVYLLMVSIFGVGLGPTIVALSTDYIFGTDSAVGYAMSLVSAVCLISAGLLTFAGRRVYAEAAFRNRVPPTPGLLPVAAKGNQPRVDVLPSAHN